MGQDWVCRAALRRIANGDEQGLETVYDRTARMIFALAYSITCHKQDAEDVLQETMVKIARNAHTYRGGSARAWILTVARNLALDTVRKRKDSVPLDDAEIAVPEPDTELLDIRTLLQHLDEDEKQILTMRLYAELPYTEIAAILNITVAAAQKRYQRVIGKLRGVAHEKA